MAASPQVQRISASVSEDFGYAPEYVTLLQVMMEDPSTSHAAREAWRDIAMPQLGGRSYGIEPVDRLVRQMIDERTAKIEAAQGRQRRMGTMPVPGQPQPMMGGYTGGESVTGLRGTIRGALKAAARGAEGTAAYMHLGNAIVKGGELATAHEAVREQRRRELREPLEGEGWASDFALNTARVIGQQAAVVPEAMQDVVAGGIAGAVTGAALGAVEPGPFAEPVTVPGGIMVGASLGFRKGHTAAWLKMGIGLFYSDLIEAGVDERIARPTAILGAIPYTAIEFMQWTRIIPGLGPSGKKALAGSIAAATRQWMAARGIQTLQEVGEEGLQEVQQVATNEIAKFIHNLTSNEQIAHTSAGQALKRSGQAMWQSGGPMAFLAGLHGTVEVAPDVSAALQRGLLTVGQRRQFKKGGRATRRALAQTANTERERAMQQAAAVLTEMTPEELVVVADTKPTRAAFKQAGLSDIGRNEAERQAVVETAQEMVAEPEVVEPITQEVKEQEEVPRAEEAGAEVEAPRQEERVQGREGGPVRLRHDEETRLAPEAGEVAPKPEKAPPLEMREEMTAAYKGQKNLTITARDTDGAPVGRLDYSVQNDVVYVQYIEVGPKRQGIGTQLYNELKKNNPGAEIQWGMRTPEGTAFKASVEPTGPAEVAPAAAARGEAPAKPRRKKRISKRKKVAPAAAAPKQAPSARTLQRDLDRLYGRMTALSDLDFEGNSLATSLRHMHGELERDATEATRKSIAGILSTLEAQVEAQEVKHGVITEQQTILTVPKQRPAIPEHEFDHALAQGEYDALRREAAKPTTSRAAYVAAVKRGAKMRELGDIPEQGRLFEKPAPGAEAPVVGWHTVEEVAASPKKIMKKKLVFGEKAAKATEQAGQERMFGQEQAGPLFAQPREAPPAVETPAPQKPEPRPRRVAKGGTDYRNHRITKEPNGVFWVEEPDGGKHGFKRLKDAVDFIERMTGEAEATEAEAKEIGDWFLEQARKERKAAPGPPKRLGPRRGERGALTVRGVRTLKQKRATALKALEKERAALKARPTAEAVKKSLEELRDVQAKPTALPLAPGIRKDIMARSSTDLVRSVKNMGTDATAEMGRAAKIIRRAQKEQAAIRKEAVAGALWEQATERPVSPILEDIRETRGDAFRMTFCPGVGDVGTEIAEAIGRGPELRSWFRRIKKEEIGQHVNDSIDVVLDDLVTHGVMPDGATTSDLLHAIIDAVEQRGTDKSFRARLERAVDAEQTELGREDPETLTDADWQYRGLAERWDRTEEEIEAGANTIRDEITKMGAVVAAGDVAAQAAELAANIEQLEAVVEGATGDLLKQIDAEIKRQRAEYDRLAKQEAAQAEAGPLRQRIQAIRAAKDIPEKEFREIIGRIAPRRADGSRTLQLQAIQDAAILKKIEAGVKAYKAPIKISKAARRMAERHGIDLRNIRASGTDGRIIVDDIAIHIKQKVDRKALNALMPKMVDTIARSKGLEEFDRDAELAKVERKRGLLGPLVRLKEGVLNFHLELRRIERFIQMLDGYKVGLIYSNVWSPIQRAWETEMEGIESNHAAMKARMKEFGLDPRKMWKGNIQPWGESGARISRTLRIEVYMAAKDPKKLRRLQEDWEYSDSEVATILASMPKSERQFGDWLMEQYQDFFERVGPMWEALTGKELGHILNYSPIMLEHGPPDFQQRHAEEMLGRYVPGATRVRFGPGKKRGKHSQNRMELDAIVNYMRYSAQAEHFMAFALRTRRVRAVLTHPEFQQAVAQKAGRHGNEILLKWLEDASGTSHMEQVNTATKVLSILRRNSAVAMLGVNVLTMLRQPLSYSTAMAYEPALAKHLLVSAFEYAHDHKALTAFVDARSTEIRHRHLTREIREMAEAKRARDILAHKGRFSDAMLYLVRATDRATVHIVWKAGFDFYVRTNPRGIKNTVTLEEAAGRYADKLVRETQPQANIKDLATLWRGGEFTKALTMFQNQFNQNYNILADQLGKRLEGKIGTGRLAWSFLAAVAIPAVASTFISHGRPPKKDELLRETLTYPLVSIPFAGTFISGAVKGYQWEASPAFAGIRKAARAAGARDTRQMARHGIGAALVGGGVPYNQPRRTIRGIRDIVAGETRDPRRLIWSRYALEGKRPKRRKTPPPIRVYRKQAPKKRSLKRARRARRPTR